MTPLTITLFFSSLVNVILGTSLYLFVNPLNNKKFHTWLLVRNILNRFNNAIYDWKKLPVTISCKDQSKEIIEKVEDKLLSKGYKVSNIDNAITIE